MGPSASASVGHVAPSAPPQVGSTPASSAGLAKLLQVENGLRAQGISPSTVHFPNFPGMVTDRSRQITPGYLYAPAPMGVSDIGLINRSGVLVPYELNTTSAAGTVSITNLQSLYVDGDGPTTYGIQMNSVAAGVTIFNNSSNEFWSQNYVDYTPDTQQLVFGDEVWNFSSSSGIFPTNSVYQYSPNGTSTAFPYLYQGYGPTITIGYPFTLTLYLNASVIADRPVFYFNYTVSNSTFRQSEMYDYLIFNSTVGTPTQPAPTPYYQADGYNYDPIGLINDMEIDLLGNDNGDMTAFTAANATVSLQYWNATADRMEEVPSAFNAGQETGETSVGLLVTSTGGTSPIANVRSGPGFVGGLWNYSSASGEVPVTLTLSPANAFLFVNPGLASNVSNAQWVPTDASGTNMFYLPSNGVFFLDFLLSDHDPTVRIVHTTTVALARIVTLAPDPAQGVYTPLFALNNSELAGISSSGNGTSGNPYILVNNQYGSLAPEFAQWDDFLFPVFPGILLANTSASVEVTPPSFEITIPSWEFGFPYLPYTLTGVPSTNNLQTQFYDASNISLVNATDISGWLGASLYEYPESSVMLWDCSHILVASNMFEDQGNALLLYGGSNNTVWGNTFVMAEVPGASPGSLDDGGTWVTGVNETESGDLLYNNYFAVPVPAITPTVDPFPCDQYGICVLLNYTDAWNVSRAPASNYSLVNGWNLTGSIVGTSYQGGNYWSNYGTASNPYGVLPFNDSGWITAGGDYVPLVLPINGTVREYGLPLSTDWSATVVGPGTSSTTLPGVSPESITFPLLPGTYNFSAKATDFSVSPSVVMATVGNNFAGVNFSFTALPGTLTFHVTPASASVTAAGAPVNLVGGSASVNLSAGVVPIEATATGYYPYFNNVTVASGGTTVLTIALNPVTPVGANGTLSLSVTPTSASAWVDGSPVSLHGGQYETSIAPGVHSIEVTASGYYPYFNNVTVKSGSPTAFTITLNPVSSGSSSSISNTGWAIIGVLAALAAIFLVLTVLFFVRSRRKPKGSSPQPAESSEPKPPQGDGSG